MANVCVWDLVQSVTHTKKTWTSYCRVNICYRRRDSLQSIYQSMHLLYITIVMIILCILQIVNKSLCIKCETLAFLYFLAGQFFHKGSSFIITIYCAMILRNQLKNFKQLPTQIKSWEITAPQCRKSGEFTPKSAHIPIFSGDFQSPFTEWVRMLEVFIRHSSHTVTIYSFPFI